MTRTTDDGVWALYLHRGDADPWMHSLEPREHFVAGAEYLRRLNGICFEAPDDAERLAVPFARAFRVLSQREGTIRHVVGSAQ